MRKTLMLLLAVVVIGHAAAQEPTPMTGRDPIEIAKVLAARYPAQPIMSYIPALAWSSQIRLSALTGDARWREKALAAIDAFVSERTAAIAEPYRLTSLAGALAFADAAQSTGNAAAGKLADKVAARMVADSGDAPVNFATGWTDDMFMATAVLARTGNGVHADSVSRLLLTYASKLQRADGLFIHAQEGPFAWGRGNGFALLGVTEGLLHMPASWPARAQVLEVYRRHLAALAKHQSDDGSWREVIDEPGSYRELTVTAMVTAAIARGIRAGWIDRQTYEPIMNRGWQAVTRRVNSDGTVKDVCASTGSGPTREYYLNRPVVNGADDRGGAMALLAAIELAELQRSR